MLSRFVAGTVLILGLCAPGPAAAQTTFETSVTFLVPVNLTQLSPDLEKVKLTCTILFDQWLNTYYKPNPAGVPMPEGETTVISGGKVNTTLRAEVFIVSGSLENAPGHESSYQCNLMGYSKSLQRWDFFSETATDAAFRLKPKPGPINGTLVW